MLGQSNIRVSRQKGLYSLDRFTFLNPAPPRRPKPNRASNLPFGFKNPELKYLQKLLPSLLTLPKSSNCRRREGMSREAGIEWGVTGLEGQDNVRNNH